MIFGHGTIPMGAVSRHASPLRLDREGFPFRKARDDGVRLEGRRLLLVEDEAMLAFALTLAFEEAGADVVGPVPTLDRALSLVGDPKFTVDLAILDVDLAGRDVYPVAEELSRRGVPILFHTGHGKPETLKRLFPQAEVIIKPALGEDLIEQIHAMLSR